MPSHNIIRQDVPGAYYHVYARGASKQPIFLEDQDKQRFISLFERYLSSKTFTSSTGELYPNYSTMVSLLAYCLMRNHFHLFVHQTDKGDLTAFMRSFMTSYARYFNLKHRRTGSLFESRFRAALIEDDAYLLHVSRYIHLNPRSWKYYPYSSIGYYRKGHEPEWLDTTDVLKSFNSRKEYMSFLYDFEDYGSTLKEIKNDLADG